MKTANPARPQKLYRAVIREIGQPFRSAGVDKVNVELECAHMTEVDYRHGCTRKKAFCYVCQMAENAQRRTKARRRCDSRGAAENAEERQEKGRELEEVMALPLPMVQSRVAELCGRKIVGATGPHAIWTPRGVPNYCYSLDAIQEALAYLSDEDARAVAFAVTEVMDPDRTAERAPWNRYFCGATALDLCRALLLVVSRKALTQAESDELRSTPQTPR